MSDDKASAFPYRIDDRSKQVFDVGMTLRDYFAAKAMNGMNPHPANERPDGIAKWAYEVADAMITERKRGEQ